MLTSWSFENALIQTYTLPYVRQIKKIIGKESQIYLYTLQTPSFYLNAEKNEAAINKLKEEGIIVLQKKYSSFGIIALVNYFFSILQLIAFCKKKSIYTIHTWCTPAGAMGYIVSLFYKCRLVLDSFEPHAEPMMEGGTWKKNSLAFKLLFHLEKKQLQRADEVICTTQSMITYSQQTYGIKKLRYFTKPACVDLTKFSLSSIKQPEIIDELALSNDTISCVYAGKFGGLYLTKETFDFLKCAFDFWGNKFRIILLTNHTKKEIEDLANQVHLPLEIIKCKFVPHKDIAAYIGAADFAICPMKPLPSRKYSAPIKNGEYMALGLPIVITRNISDDSDIISNNKLGSVIKDLNSNGYTESIKEIDGLLKKHSREELYNKIRPFAEKYRNFDIAEKVYTQIYNPVK